MGKKQTQTHPRSVLPRLRVMLGREIALGPGRIELLELIHATGSLQAAARQMKISYMRAWQLVKFTNRCFTKPLVSAVRGGKSGGGAELTQMGRQVVALYRKMEKQSQKAIQPAWKSLGTLLKS